MNNACERRKYLTMSLGFFFYFLVIMGVYDYYFEYGIIAELVGRLVVWLLEWIF